MHISSHTTYSPFVVWGSTHWQEADRKLEIKFVCIQSCYLLKQLPSWTQKRVYLGELHATSCLVEEMQLPAPGMVKTKDVG